ncbi:MAG: prepilin-type N-terminal cleavage/methylation domain-containing protein [Opitutae bacterium]|nr:prepilin-type N-terminal cleavage/methylation domain-containing protein [Opitutae bacterium]
MKLGRGTSRRAFTLLELLVAVGIGALLVTLLLSVALAASNLWTRANGRIATAATARAVLDQLEADLQAAVFREDGNVWMSATVLTTTSNSGAWVSTNRGRAAADSLVLTEPAIADDRFGAAGTWLRFFTDAGGRNTANLRAVAYQIVRRAQSSASGAEVSYLLFRSVVSDANTFAAGYNLDPTTGGYRTANATVGNAGNVLRPPLDTVLADHVVDFGVRFFRSNATALRPLFPATPAGDWTNDELTHLVRLGGSGTSDSARPDAVEIMIRVLTDEGVRQLRNFENPPPGYTSTGTWWDIVVQHSHVYTRRVVLPQGAS